MNRNLKNHRLIIKKLFIFLFNIEGLGISKELINCTYFSIAN